MMDKKTRTISPQKKLPAIQNYNELRLLGLKYIEQLGSDFWTDYNSHDPGITTLEVLSYALTELGYRMGFPMRDLLEGANTEPHVDDTIFTARNILTTHPVTTLDYRKILADLPQVANAWLMKANPLNPPVFADCKTKNLSFNQTENPLEIKGVWDVLLELEKSDEFGEINAPGFYYTINKGSLKDQEIEFIAHTRPDITWNSWLVLECNKAEITAWQKNTNTEWALTLQLTLDGELEKVKKQLDFTLIAKGVEKENPDIALKNVIKALGVETLIDAYLKRERYVLSVLEAVNFTLQRNRNLCEDFRKITLISAEEVSFCADIDVSPKADLEEIEANIILAIEDYLSPKVAFYSLLDLQKEGIVTDAIFNGPKLNHGFINDDELRTSELRKAIYTSDIINLIMDIDGVKSVSNFVMSKFTSAGKLQVKAEKWALNITENHKSRYARNKSKWLFFKNKIPFVTRTQEVDDIMQLISAEVQQSKLLKNTVDLLPPIGNYRELDQYFTIQNDFPKLYGVSNEGFPDNATQERINKAKQFQGYLQFFDQVLADLLAQVANFKNYVSLDKNLDHTYFTSFVQEIPGASYIYKNAALLQTELPEISEEKETFLARRNQVLDHLLSRFQESFNNHVLTLYTQSGTEKAKEELIADKISFLKDYPEKSSRRFTAINLLEAGAWPYSASSGLKTRASQLAGINNTDERFLMPVRLELLLQSPPEDNLWKVQWLHRESNAKIFVSSNKIEGKENAMRMARKGFQRFVEGGFEVKKAGAKFRIVFGNAEHEHRSNALYAKEKEALAEAHALNNLLNETSEGMNLFEHLLLRPFDKMYQLMDACIPDNCAFCGDEDPYSFKLSVVLPYWPNRFRKMAYRRHIEELIHKECPAHILPKVCWADPFTWQELEDAYYLWLNARLYADKEERRNTTTRLIRALESVETVYPEAVLHDCEDDRDENPVVLNQTKLGIF